ncbi:MAG: hypothetical protein ACKVPX_17875 [Myxococcaceae bacterium]
MRTKRKWLRLQGVSEASVLRNGVVVGRGSMIDVASGGCRIDYIDFEPKAPNEAVEVAFNLPTGAVRISGEVLAADRERSVRIAFRDFAAGKSHFDRFVKSPLCGSEV